MNGRNLKYIGISEASWPAPAAALEAGAVVFLPGQAFDVQREQALFSPGLASSKNVSFDPASGRLGGTPARGDERSVLTAMLTRFSADSDELVAALFPEYAGDIVRARASFRPAEIAGRATSWRHDDTRLHIDSFPATPVQGRRILRVFANVNPEGRPRLWRVGEEFERVARRFVGDLRLPLPGVSAGLRLLGLTKSVRSVYDALMLQLHDRMKADAQYQADAPQITVEFPAGSTWVAFTDQVSHAAMAGQYQLEQTFLLPIATMREPARSPLRILERLTGRALVSSTAA